MFKLYMNTSAVNRQLKQLNTNVTTSVKDVHIPRYFQELQSIVAKATELARIQIKMATTETGKKRAAKSGGLPGRIESKKFYDNLKWEVKSQDKGVYKIRIGWFDGEPDWATYQELGFTHRSGMYVAGADALGEASRYIELEIEKLKRRKP